VSKALDELTASKADFASREAALRDQLRSVEESAAQSIDTIRKDADSRIAELRAEVTTQRSRLDTALNEHQTAFAAAQEKRLTDFDETLKGVEAELTSFTETELGKQRVLHEKGSALAASLEEKLNRANEILGFTAAANVAQAYIEEGASQKKEADKWRLIALCIIGALAVVAFISFVVLKPDAGFSTEDYVRYALVRLPVFVVLAPAIPWVLKQSSEHREREHFARLRGQELTSFRPFLAELTEAERQTVIKDASARFFKGDSHLSN
jgi:hypothetical protein